MLGILNDDAFILGLGGGRSQQTERCTAGERQAGKIGTGKLHGILLVNEQTDGVDQGLYLT